MRNFMIKGVLALTFGLSASLLSAQELAPLPTQTDAHGTVYLSGGIGETELEQVNQAARDFPLKLILAERTGAYVADVKVAIVDGHGRTVLEVPSVGPILLVQLAPGRYRVWASYEGLVREQRINLNRAHKTVSLAW